MRVSLWETAFFREFKVHKGVYKNYNIDKQLHFKSTIQRTIYRYFKYVLFPAKAISKTPSFFDNYLDTGGEECMFTEGILKSWSTPHLEMCGWYLDCPPKRPPTFDIALRNSIEPSLKGSVTLAPKSTDKVVRKKSRATKRMAVEEVIVCSDEDAPLANTFQNLVVASLSSSNATPEVSLPKRQKAAAPQTTQVSQPASIPSFEQPPKQQAMMSKLGSTSSARSSLEFIVNDSFVRIIEQLKQKGSFPALYKDIVAFLTKVGKDREFFFDGKVQQKPAIDLIIVDFPDGLPMPGISDPSSQVPHWNAHIPNFFQVIFAFALTYLHDDDGFLLFYPDSAVVKKELAGFFKNYKLKIKAEWTIVNSLHLTSSFNPSKKTLMSKAVFLVRSLPSSVSRHPQDIAIASYSGIPGVDLSCDDVLFNSVTEDSQLRRQSDEKPWRGAKQKSDMLMKLFIDGLSLASAIVADFTASTGPSIRAAQSLNKHILALESDAKLFEEVLIPLRSPPPNSGTMKLDVNVEGVDSDSSSPVRDVELVDLFA